MLLRSDELADRAAAALSEGGLPITALDGALKKLGSRLIIRSGNTIEELSRLCREIKATAVHWSRRYEPCVVRRDEAIQASLREVGVTVESHDAALLFEPGAVRTKQGGPYQVFTPFWNACRAADPPPKPLAAPPRLPAPNKWPRSLALAAMLLPIAGPAAMAQSAAAVHAACGTYLKPAFSKPSKDAPKGVTVDCGCVVGYLVGRYGAADAQVIVRLFAAAGGGSEKEMEAVGKEIGPERIKAVIGKVGKFQELGRQMNEVCPETKNP